MRFARVVGLLLALGLPLTAGRASAQAESSMPVGIQCRDLPALFRVFVQQHYSVRRIDDALEKHTAGRFVEIIDPSKSLLLASEVQRLQNELPTTFADAVRGDCTRLDAAWALVMQRAAQDEHTASDMLTPAFKIDDKTELMLDPQKRQYAKDDDERTQRIRSMIQFQVLSYLNAGLSMDQAKRQLIHRYGLIDKRLSERQNKGEIPGLWAQAFAEALDPHSAYMPPDELTDFEIALKLSLEGIGAVLTSDDGFTVIQSLVPGGQAAKTGQLRPKDKIIAVAQENEAPVPTIDMDLSDVVKMIRGKKGTRVSLTVLREGKTTSTFIVSIVRDKIDVSSQAAKITYQTHKVGERTVKLGILELPSFYGGERGGRSSYEDVKRLLAEARAQKVDGVVLDLSRNGGGLLDDAVRISGLFIKRGAVVGTKSADGKLSVLDDTDANVEWAGPLVVVISHASASASEIVAGALHDYHRAIIVGSEKTFGKGTVQVVVPMPSEIGAIRVTTGMFFLPGGDSTQLKGVPSDVAVPSVFDGFNLGEDKLEYALPAQSVPSFVSTAANGNGGDDHWEPVPQAIVASLAERSKARVAAEPAFAKIREQLQDLAKNKDPVHLGDLRKRSSKDKTAPAATHNTKGPGAKDRNAGKGSKNDTGDMADDDTQVDSLQQAVVNEGANILADAIGAGLGRPLAAAR